MYENDATCGNLSVNKHWVFLAIDPMLIRIASGQEVKAPAGRRGLSLSSSPLLHLPHNTRNLRVSSKATPEMCVNYWGTQVSDMALS
jgi:hypothetical protein